MNAQTSKRTMKPQSKPFVPTSKEKAFLESYRLEEIEKAKDTHDLLVGLGFASARGAEWAEGRRANFTQSIINALPLLDPGDLFAVMVITGRLSGYKAQ